MKRKKNKFLKLLLLILFFSRTSIFKVIDEKIMSYTSDEETIEKKENVGK